MRAMNRKRWIVLAAVAVGGVLADQVTKQLAHAYVRGRGIVTVVDGFFELRYARNPGAFFSLGAELDPNVRRIVFVAASVAATVLIVRLYARATEAQRLLRGAMLLLLSGALGNLIDRALYGEVIDFAHLYWRGVFDWATFNVADVLITGGLLLLVADLFVPRRADAEAPPLPEPPPPPDRVERTVTETAP